MSLKVLMSLLEKIMYACLTRFIWDFEWFQAVRENFFISIVIIVFITLKMSHFMLPFCRRWLIKSDEGLEVNMKNYPPIIRNEETAKHKNSH